MLLKTADDRSSDIEALETLLRRPGLDAHQERAVRDEIWAIRLGSQAENGAAYQLDFSFRDNKNWVVIHDLRIDVDGSIAQIDHLVISRLLEVFVCESKSYSGGVKVNEHGEWLTFRDRRPVGIPSPVEQNRRHIEVLERAIQRGYVELPRRLVAIKPTYRNVVLVSEGGLITRPKKSLPDLDSVMKVDQFETLVMNRDFSTTQILKIVGSETLETFGRQLVALHSPAKVDWARRFGVLAPPPDSMVAPRPGRSPWLVKYDGPCSNCGKPLAKGTPAVWRQSKRRMYCLECGAA